MMASFCPFLCDGPYTKVLPNTKPLSLVLGPVAFALLRGLGGSGLWVAPTPRLVSGWASLELWRQLDSEALFQKLHVSEVLVNRRVAVGMT